MGAQKLGTKKVSSIDENFFVPSYQRGYRWGKEEVKRLLEDIYENGMNGYCLQPIVVKSDGERYELIDGQQRLTTIYLIYKALGKVLSNIAPKFKIKYELREKSEIFLENIETQVPEDNIDYFFMRQAYEEIINWIESKSDKFLCAINFYKYLGENVQVIWYEADESEDSISLFTRLNIGKIPLTSAELVKAMFLSRNNTLGMTKEKQEEIALQWDNIERELHNESLWHFLTDRNYSTRIDLILDMITDKPVNHREKHYTFFKLYEMSKNESLDEIWFKIQHAFLTLRDWYEDHDLYHKIGYLIAAKEKSLADIFTCAQSRKKSEFNNTLDEFIRESIKSKVNYGAMSYENSNDYNCIKRLLLLFNIESVRTIDGKSQRFPFDKFKRNNRGSEVWSLEHIHAQNAEKLTREADWIEWIKIHIPTIREVDSAESELVAQMEKVVQENKVNGSVFQDIQKEVNKILKVDESVIHTIANLALLSTRDNSALNNSAFDVKRNEIIRMDKQGQFIPFCTKMVFLKYYTPSDRNQMHFWGKYDRDAYIEAMNRVLKDYLDKEIVIETFDARKEKTN